MGVSTESREMKRIVLVFCLLAVIAFSSGCMDLFDGDDELDLDKAEDMLEDASEYGELVDEGMGYVETVDEDDGTVYSEYGADLFYFDLDGYESTGEFRNDSDVVREFSVSWDEDRLKVEDSGENHSIDGVNSREFVGESFIVEMSHRSNWTYEVAGPYLSEVLEAEVSQVRLSGSPRSNRGPANLYELDLTVEDEAMADYINALHLSVTGYKPYELSAEDIESSTVTLYVTTADGEFIGSDALDADVETGELSIEVIHRRDEVIR